MSKPVGVQEYDGYVIPKPRQMTKEELEAAEKRIQELRKKIAEANKR